MLYLAELGGESSCDDNFESFDVDLLLGIFLQLSVRIIHVYECWNYKHVHLFISRGIMSTS